MNTLFKTTLAVSLAIFSSTAAMGQELAVAKSNAFYLLLSSSIFLYLIIIIKY